MKLEIISPEKILYSGEAELITLPGTSGSFTVLEHHAPLISSLEKGKLVYRVKGEDKELTTNGGFAEVKNNEISVCIE